jgi:transposase-like protein
MVSSPLGNCPDASQDDLKGDSEMNHHDLITAPLAKFSSQVTPRGRRIKFTPERIQQINNLVERGKSREEIAELIGVTPGSLQVTCSRLGISLRRPSRSDNGIRLLPRRNAVSRNGRTGPSSDGRVPPQPIDERSRRDSRPSPPEQTQLTTAHQEWPKRREADLATLALTIRYKGEERTTKLALTHHAIGQLALEAGLRDRRIGEFIGELISGTIQKNLLHRVLDIS